MVKRRMVKKRMVKKRMVKKRMVKKLCMQNKNLTFAVKKELRWKRTLI